MIRLLIFYTCVAFSGPAGAQGIIAEYYTSLREGDRHSSSGRRLTDLCAIIQQDRANYHRFGRRDDGDMGDPVFGSPEARAQIAGRCVVMPGSEYLADFLQRGIDRYVRVVVFGKGNRIDRLEISQGAG